MKMNKVTSVEDYKIVSSFQTLRKTLLEDRYADRLAALGGPAVRSVRSVGGGAVNPAWTRLRENALGVPFLPSRSAEAAVGTASLVLAGKARWS